MALDPAHRCFDRHLSSSIQRFLQFIRRSIRFWVLFFAVQCFFGPRFNRVVRRDET